MTRDASCGVQLQLRVDDLGTATSHLLILAVCGFGGHADEARYRHCIPLEVTILPIIVRRRLQKRSKDCKISHIVVVAWPVCGGI